LTRLKLIYSCATTQFLNQPAFQQIRQKIRRRATHVNIVAKISESVKT